MSEQSQSGMIIYQTEDGLTKIDVAFENDTVWLSLEQIAELFQRDRTVIGRHIKNVFSEGELQKNSVCAKFAHTAADGKTYQVDYYNLDMIISVGYRVKSQRGVQFRIWASGVIKEYMKKGFAIGQREPINRWSNASRISTAITSISTKNRKNISERIGMISHDI